MGHERQTLDKIFDIVDRAFSNLPDALKPKTKTDTKRMIQFLERFDGQLLDSEIYVSLKVRGGTVRRLHITESAYVKDRQELNAGSKQAVPIDGTITEETTANGYNEFFDEFEDARANSNPTALDYKAYFYPWVANRLEYTIPGILENKTAEEIQIVKIAKEQYDIDVTDNQLLWRRWKIKELGKNREGFGLSPSQLFKQEYPLTPSEAFQSASGNVFNAEMLDSLTPPDPLTDSQFVLKATELYPNQAQRDKVIDVFRNLTRRGVVFWEVPTPGRKYVSGVDPSDGTGSDNGAISVWDAASIAQVAQFYGRLRPDELAQLSVDVSEFFNEAFLGVENNMLSTVLFVKETGYSNYYSYVEIDKRTEKRTRKIGWNTNSKTRDVMIDDFVISFEEDNLIIRSKRTISEMRTFVTNENGKREHAKGKHDDALFADMIALQMRKYNGPRARVISQKPAGF